MKYEIKARSADREVGMAPPPNLKYNSGDSWNGFGDG